MAEADNLKLLELFVSSISHESFVDQSTLQLHTPSHDKVQFHNENSEPIHSEKVSHLHAGIINRSSTQSNQEGRVAGHAIATSSNFEANRCYLETGDCVGHEAVTLHGNENPHACKFCGKTFIFKSYFDMHLMYHSNERPHLCDICNKNFKTKGHLKQHMLIHSDERPFQCNICNRDFKMIGDLLRHRLTHREERPFQCDICKKHFKTEGYLKYHKVLHSDYRPYECDVCNRRLKRIWNLRQHKLLHDDETKMSATSVAQPLKRHFI